MKNHVIDMTPRPDSAAASIVYLAFLWPPIYCRSFIPRWTPSGLAVSLIGKEHGGGGHRFLSDHFLAEGFIGFGMAVTIMVSQHVGGRDYAKLKETCVYRQAPSFGGQF